MPGGGGEGRGLRGEVEITHTSFTDRVWIPLVIAGLSAGIWGMTVIIALLIYSAWMWKNAGWARLTYHLWERNLLLWSMTAVLVAWPISGVTLLVFNFVPKILNDNWPPPWAQAAVDVLGAFTFWKALRHPPEETEDSQITHTYRIMLTKQTPTGHETKLVELPGHPGLPDFAKAILEGKHPTQALARRYDIYRNDWITIRDHLLLRNILKWKNPDNTRLGLRLATPEDDGYESGAAIMRALAAGEAE